jgi:hypothetical protein
MAINYTGWTKKLLCRAYGIKYELLKKWVIQDKIMSEEEYGSMSIFKPATIKKIFSLWGPPDCE